MCNHRAFSWSQMFKDLFWKHMVNFFGIKTPPCINHKKIEEEKKKDKQETGDDQETEVKKKRESKVKMMDKSNKTRVWAKRQLKRGITQV